MRELFRGVWRINDRGDGLGQRHFANMATESSNEGDSFQLELLVIPPQVADRAPTTPVRKNSSPKSQARTIKSFAEFFAGIGLVRLALASEGWTAMFANDIDPDKFSIYSANFPGAEFELGDIKSIGPQSISNALLATASFPCTDLSLAGERRGLEGKHSGTLWSFFDIVRRAGESRPKLILLENVIGFLSSHKGQDFRATIRELNALGYECDAFVLNALHFVPQSRPRLFLFAVESGSVLPYETVAECARLPKHPARPEQLIRAIRANNDLRWKLAQHLPSLPALKGNLDQVVEVIPTESELWWDTRREKHLLSQLSPRHKAALRHLMSLSVVSVATVYRRMRGDRIRAELRCDGIAGCLRTPRGGSSRQILLFAGKGLVRVRHMTPREYARLQGVPDSFKIGNSVSKALFGFGDAVCVPAIRWLARHVINPAASALVVHRPLVSTNGKDA